MIVSELCLVKAVFYSVLWYKFHIILLSTALKQHTNDLLPIFGIISTIKNTRPPILLSNVNTRLVTPSATGYVTSHAISKYRGEVEPSNIQNRIIDIYNWTENKISLQYINLQLFY